jgi:hypothetical protein
MSDEREDLRNTLEKLIDAIWPGPPRELDDLEYDKRLYLRNREMQKEQPVAEDVPLGTGIANEGAEKIKSRRQAIEDAIAAAGG